ncbi:MAG: GDP-D-mannose 3',5'-epimerase [Parasphingorhabdus sp.]|jgi:GDP-D-mannose 3',5'-epimerase
MQEKKRALVCGAGGFIGHHLVDRLKSEGYWVRGVDLKRPLYADSAADEFLVADLTSETGADQAVYQSFYEIYQ